MLMVDFLKLFEAFLKAKIFFGGPMVNIFNAYKVYWYKNGFDRTF